MTWPTNGTWRALHSGQQTIGDEVHTISVVNCGSLVLPSGRLVAADPFVTLVRTNRYYPVPAGSYPVQVTIDETLQREMYVSLIIRPEAESDRRLLVPSTPDGQPCPAPEEDEYYGVAVDAGTVCFVDDAGVQRGMPADDATWYTDLFDNRSPTSWFNLMDDPAHLRKGLANITLPLATDGANIVICHSGWGDGFYPVVGSFDAAGNLIAAHIDLLIHYDG